MRVARALGRLVHVVALAAGLALAGCASSGPSVPAAPPGSQGAPPPSGAIAPPTPQAPVAPEVTAAPLGPPGQPAERPAARVALLLPLSGANAAIGRALQEAAQLAVFDNADQNFQLITKDTRSDPAGAAQAAEQALTEGARLIIGPLTAAETAAVAPLAIARNVAVLSLSNDRGAAQAGVWVLGHTPQSQMMALIGYARSRGLSRFATLVPNNPFGIAAEDAVRAAGISLVASERYDGGNPVESVQRLAGQAGGFDTLVVPDLAPGLLVIGPLLAQNRITAASVRLLGSQFMETDARVAREPSLHGAWYAAPPADARADFERRYRGAYGRPPPRLATLGYDAAALAAVLGKAPGGADFSLGVLTSASGFSGMDGVFRLRPDGSVERVYAIYELAAAGPRMVDPGRRSFEDLTR